MLRRRKALAKNTGYSSNLAQPVRADGTGYPQSSRSAALKRVSRVFVVSGGFPYVVSKSVTCFCGVLSNNGVPSCLGILGRFASCVERAAQVLRTQMIPSQALEHRDHSVKRTKPLPGNPTDVQRPKTGVPRSESWSDYSGLIFGLVLLFGIFALLLWASFEETEDLQEL